MRVVGLIQARMGSSRLPGKMMLPLDGEHVISHVVNRVTAASSVDEAVVATTTETSDDILERYGSRSGASVFRGSEDDVLSRMYEAASEYEADIIVRITGDSPMVPPAVIDAVTEALRDRSADYSSSVLEKTFPVGLGAEAFTFESFGTVEESATASYEREHVTPYYRERPDLFDCHSVTSQDVFGEPWLQNRVDLRLTLDEADDYELLHNVYRDVTFDGILPVKDAVQFIDENDLDSINESVDQNTLEDIAED